MKVNKIYYLIFMIIICSCLNTGLFAQYKVSNSVFINGGGQIIDDNNTIRFSLGQPISGITDNDLYTCSFGFWYNFNFITSINETDENNLPRIFELYQNYPNPFNPQTNIYFTLPKSVPVKIEIFNILGQRIKVLTNKNYPAGFHKIIFSGANFGSGIYFLYADFGGHIFTKKMSLLK